MLSTYLRSRPVMVVAGTAIMATTMMGLRRRMISSAATKLGGERAAEYKNVKYSVSPEGVATVTMNRPARYNALSKAMYDEISEALARAGRDAAVRVLLLTAEGKYYSSGNDLANFAKFMHPRTLAAQSRELLQGFVGAFVDFPHPMVVAVNGPAIGIAVTTLGLCDQVFAVQGATFHTPFRALGQSPEGCSTFMFPRLMGEANAHRVLEEDWKFTAEEAKQMGLVKEVFATPEAALANAQQVCRQIAGLPDAERSQQRMIKRESGLREVLQKVNAEECRVIEGKWMSRECFDAIGSFLYGRRQTVAALAIMLANNTRWAWDR